jgi:hypothetical protein
MIDKDEYPQTAELEMRCVNMLSRLWNSPDDERDPKAARVIHIRNSPTIPAEGARPASVHDALASARAANEGNRTRGPHRLPADRL